MELKSYMACQENNQTLLLIAPLMELKYHNWIRFQCHVYTFNRTAYGIEIDNYQRRYIHGGLLIAPLMELKLQSEITTIAKSEPFNRTAYGIEIDTFEKKDLF